MKQNRNLIYHLGYQTYGEYDVFKGPLSIPLVYLKHICKNNKSLINVPYALHRVVAEVHATKWKELMQGLDLNETVRRGKLKASGIPPHMLETVSDPKGDAAALAFFRAAVKHTAKVAAAGRVVYFHSEREHNALIAAAEIAKAAVSEGVKTYMVNLPQFAEDVKNFDEPTSTMERLDDAQLAIVYLIGSTYASKSGYVEAMLNTLIRKRMSQGRTTILVSHLTPQEFEDYYKLSLDKWSAAVAKFEDPKIKPAIADLTKMLMEDLV